MDKILVATDFSASSEHLLSCVEDLGRAGIKEVVLVNVMYEGESEDGVMSKLAELRGRLEEKNFKVSVFLRWGEPAEEIREAAVDQNVDFILVSSKGKQYFKRTFIGSTSAKLVELATCPVIIEKDDEILLLQEQSVHFKKILVPTDFSLASLEALDIIKVMREYIGEVVFVNVIEDKKVDEKEVEHVNYNLAELVEEMAGFGIKASSFIEYGTASKEIINLSQRIDISMVILPKVSGSVMKNILLGSTAQAVAIGIDIPVMMVPADLNR